MTRPIVLDTEITDPEPAECHRIVEIGEGILGIPH